MARIRNQGPSSAAENAAATMLAKDLFAPLGEIVVRKMFGGAGVYCDGVIFGLIAEGELYLKTDAMTEERFRQAGSHPFVWVAPNTGRTTQMRYWTLPDAAVDDQETALEWGQLALATALTAQQAKHHRQQKRLQRLEPDNSERLKGKDTEE